MDKEDAESSFKELLDWMRYLAQHKGQQGRLTNLLTEAVSSLRALSGETGATKAASYAAAAATSAAQPTGPSKPKPRPAQTVKQSKRLIQHPVPRFERASKELPGAPRDTLLNIVARSDLKTAPPPLPKVPGPKKRASCLVKGIRSNTIAFRLPENATYPVSIPATIAKVNKSCEEQELDILISEILIGVRRHITIVFNKAIPTGDAAHTAAEEVLQAFKTDPEAAHQLERTTHSILKFNAVPTIYPNRKPISAEVAEACIRQHPAWEQLTFLDTPRFVPNKANPDSHYATLQVKVLDSQKGTTARKLLETSVSFVGITRRCLPWTVPRTARQCPTCLKWGHTAYLCKSRAPTCNQCAGPHLSSYHKQHAADCKDRACNHAGIFCANCAQQHHASSMMCPFFRNHSNPGELQKLQKARVERLRRVSN